METIFYDGGCGLCHALVRYVAARDAQGRLFEFAPIGGELFCSVVPDAARRTLPDSIVLQTTEGTLLMRSAAVLHILPKLGKAWSVLAAVLAVLPAGFSDSCYNGVARLRRRLFGVPGDVCPVLPPHLRSRFRR